MFVSANNSISRAPIGLFPPAASCDAISPQASIKLCNRQGRFLKSKKEPKKKRPFKSQKGPSKAEKSLKSKKGPTKSEKFRLSGRLHDKQFYGTANFKQILFLCVHLDLNIEQQKRRITILIVKLSLECLYRLNGFILSVCPAFGRKTNITIKNGVHRTTVRSVKLFRKIKCKLLGVSKNG